MFTLVMFGILFMLVMFGIVVMLFILLLPMLLDMLITPMFDKLVIFPILDMAIGMVIFTIGMFGDMGMLPMFIFKGLLLLVFMLLLVLLLILPLFDMLELFILLFRLLGELFVVGTDELAISIFLFSKLLAWKLLKAPPELAKFPENPLFRGYPEKLFVVLLPNTPMLAEFVSKFRERMLLSGVVVGLLMVKLLRRLLALLELLPMMDDGEMLPLRCWPNRLFLLPDMLPPAVAIILSPSSFAKNEKAYKERVSYTIFQ
jgi:hypothetical protein